MTVTNGSPTDMTSSTVPDIHGQKLRAALVSVVVKILLTIGKFIAAGLSGSLALLSEAGNNLGDIAVTLMSFYSIRMAAQPADEDHPFGHGKIEALSALIQTGFLFALAIFILIEAAKRLAHGTGDVEPDAFAFGVLIVSIVVDTSRWYSLNKIAKQTRSPALAADALNFATDIVASTLALLGLTAALYGYVLGDAVAAIAVAVFVAVAGFRLGRETVGTLIDTAPRGVSDRIRSVVDTVPGVIAIDSLRLRPMGDGIVGDVIIRVSRTLPFDRVGSIKADVVAAIKRHDPNVDVTVTAEPIALDDETVVERVLHIANRRRVPIHHVTVQALTSGHQSVSFDAELDKRMALGQAHEIVTDLELAIGRELGPEFEVESHIEPLEETELNGKDCDPQTLAKVTEALQRRIPHVGSLSDPHDVRVRETPAGLVVNYHCLADPNMSVGDVHGSVDELERQVRKDCDAIVRIVGHAEPFKARDHG